MKYTITAKLQGFPCNFSHFTLEDKITIALRDGQAISCSKCKSATQLHPCQHMSVANAEPDKDQYWSPYHADDLSDLIDD